MGNLLTQTSLTDNTTPSFHQEIPNKDEHKANPPDFYLNKSLFKNDTTTSQIIAKFINSTQTILNTPHNNNTQQQTSSLSKLFKQTNNTPDHPNNLHQQDQIIIIKETQSAPNDSFITNQKENNNNSNSNDNNNYTCNSIHNSPNKNCIRYNRKHKKTKTYTFKQGLKKPSSSNNNNNNNNNDGDIFVEYFDSPKIKTIAGSLPKDIRKIYKIRDLLGGGHFGTVRIGYRRSEEPKKYYAIKSISKKNLSDKDLSDLIKEVDIISGLDHPNIIKFNETYHDKYYFHIVMELCRGKEVFDRIIENGHIKERKVCQVIMKLLNAISYCHSRGITHRDLKPENILFETSEPDSEIKLIDFGLSRKYSQDEKMHTILGTPYYVAPEVLRGEYDEKCDLWSIGALCYIMLSGQPPFKGSSNNEIFNKILRDDVDCSGSKWRSISQEAHDFVKLCLNKNAEKRPSAIEALEQPWFKSLLDEVHSDKNIDINILENLKNYNIKESLKKMVIRFLVNMLNEQEIKKYKTAFYAIDIRHNGTIDLDELEHSFHIANIQIEQNELIRIIQMIDDSGKGSLDYTEFLIGCIDKNEIITTDKINAAFKYFDVDGSGKIEINDLKDAMLRFGKKVLNVKDVSLLITEIFGEDKYEIKQDDFLDMFDL